MRIREMKMRGKKYEDEGNEGRGNTYEDEGDQYERKDMWMKKMKVRGNI